MPSIYCGILTLILTVLYFLIASEKKRIKALYGAVIAFYLVGMAFIPLDRFLHGLREANCFQARYGYVLCFLLLLLSYRALPDLLGKYPRIMEIKWVAPVLAVYVLLELTLNGANCLNGLQLEMHYASRNSYLEALKSKSAMLQLIDDDGWYRISDTKGYAYNNGAWLGYNGLGYFSSCYHLKLMDFLGSMGENQT